MRVIRARRFIDGTVTLSFRTGASVTTWAQQLIGKAVDASNHLCVQMTQAGAIAIVVYQVRRAQLAGIGGSS